MHKRLSVAWVRLGRAVVAVVAALVPAAGLVGPGTTADATVGSAAQAGDPLTVTVNPSTGVQPGQVVEVTIDGPAGATVSMGQCATTVFPDSCDPGGTAFYDLTGDPVTVPFTVRNYIHGTVAGPYMYCGDCYIAALNLAGPGFAAVPIHIEPGPLAITVLGDDEFVHEGGAWPQNLWDGAPLNVAVTGVRSTDTTVALCSTAVVASHDVAGGPCTQPQAIPAGSDPGRVWLTAEDRFTGADASDVVCRRDDCLLAVAGDDGSAFATSALQFAFPLLLAADPSTGLVDGQQVHVTGEGVPQTYDGPPFWIVPQTGHWVIAQCDERLAYSPSLYDVFRYCTSVPGLADVEVTGPSLDVGPVPVQSSFTSFLGERVDCAASPAPCVIALARVESNGATSVAVTRPLAFATP